jgi:hypothetical protein
LLDKPAAKYEAEAAGMVEMDPFRGLVPDGWNDLEPGVYARAVLDGDPTVLVQMAAPDCLTL